MSKWHDVEVPFSVELGYDQDSGWQDLTYEKGLPTALLVELEKLPIECDGVELDFDVRSSGYYQPAKTSGLPENCYPEEGDDEREVKGVYLLVDDKRIPLYKTLADELTALYEEEIQAVELPDCEGGD